MEEEHSEEDAWHKGPIRWIGGLFLILMVILWLIPVASIKLDPSPDYIPQLGEVIPSDIVVNETHSISISPDMVNGHDPTVKAVADKIVTEACTSGKICHAKALFYFVRDNFDYVSDPTAYEYVKTTKQSLVSGGGDCDDASVVLASLLDAIGVPTRFVFVPRHVYVQAHLPGARNKYKAEGDWVNLDATCSDCAFGEITYSSSAAEKRYLS